MEDTLTLAFEPFWSWLTTLDHKRIGALYLFINRTDFGRALRRRQE